MLHTKRDVPVVGWLLLHVRRVVKRGEPQHHLTPIATNTFLSLNTITSLLRLVCKTTQLVLKDYFIKK